LVKSSIWLVHRCGSSISPCLGFKETCHHTSHKKWRNYLEEVKALNHECKRSQKRMFQTLDTLKSSQTQTSIIFMKSCFIQLTTSGWRMVRSKVLVVPHFCGPMM
jgi:hypothetical protein